MNTKRSSELGAVSGFLLMLTIQAFAPCPGFCEPNVLNGWPVTITETNAEGGAYSGDWYGPLAADIDANGTKEIITCNNRAVYVYDADGSAHFATAKIYRISDADWGAGYQILGIPSVGDVNADGILDIVIILKNGSEVTNDFGTVQHTNPQHPEWGQHQHTLRHVRNYIKIVIINGDDEAVYISNPMLSNFSSTAVLSDLDVLDYPNNPSYEDGRMEIILAGLNSRAFALAQRIIYQQQWVTCYYPEYASRSWGVSVFLLSDANQIVVMDTGTDVVFGGENISRTTYIPAIGDMDGDGKKEIVFSHEWGVGGWTYDPEQGVNHKLIALDWNAEVGDEFIRPSGFNGEGGAGPTDGSGFYAMGPVLADIDNSGELWAMVPHYNGVNGEQGLHDDFTHLFIVDISGNEHGAWARLDFPGGATSGAEFEQISIGDIDNGGIIQVSFHTHWQYRVNEWSPWVAYGLLYWTRNHGAVISQNWPQPIRDLTSGFVPSPTFCQIQEGQERASLWIAHSRRGLAEQNVFGFNQNDQNGNATFQWDLDNQNNNTNFSVVAIADIDNAINNGLKNLEMAVRSLDGNGTEKIQIWTLDESYNPEESNELERIEWSQLGNGPRHAGLYAQPYSGLMPVGNTYWRDRVIITDDVTTSSAGGRYVYIVKTTPTVVEFNNQSTLYMSGVRFVDGPYVHVFKGNAQNDEFTLILDDPFMGMQLSGVHNGEVIRPGGGVVEFIDVTFVSNRPSQTAFTATGADVTFTNCTFRGYATALELDNCTGTIQNCTFEDITGTAVMLANSGAPMAPFVIENCTFMGSGNAAVYAYNSTADLTGNTVTGTGSGTLGAAVYSYNSTVNLRDNNITDNALVGFRASGEGSVYMTNWLETFANRIADNLTATHTPKTDSTWAEMIQVSPTYTYWGTGHNDFISASGDYLISNHAYGSSSFPFDGSYNYYDCNGGVGSGDFYPSGSVNYLPSDLYPNHISSIEDEEAALALFRSAKQAADSGNTNAAIEGFLEIVSGYPGTALAPSALRAWYDIAPSVARSNVLNSISREMGPPRLANMLSDW